MLNLIHTDLSLRPKWMSFIALMLNLVLIAAASLIVFVRLRETLVQTTAMAMLVVVTMVIAKVPSMLFRNVVRFPQSRLFRYAVAITVVLVFLLIKPLF